MEVSPHRYLLEIIVCLSDFLRDLNNHHEKLLKIILSCRNKIEANIHFQTH